MIRLPSFSGSSLFPFLSFTFGSVQFTISTFSVPSALPSLRVRQTQTAQLGRDIQRVIVNLFSSNNIYIGPHIPHIAVVYRFSIFFQYLLNILTEHTHFLHLWIQWSSSLGASLFALLLSSTQLAHLFSSRFFFSNFPCQ